MIAEEEIEEALMEVEGQVLMREQSFMDGVGGVVAEAVKDVE